MRKIAHAITAVLIFTAQSNYALGDDALNTIQKSLREQNIYKGEISGELDFNTVISLSKACDIDNKYCNDARKYASAFYFIRYHSIRYALVTDREAYSPFVGAFNFLKKVNKIEAKGWSFITVFMRAAIVSSIRFDGDIQDVFYYNPVLDIALVLRVNRGNPEKAFFVSGESIRGESYSDGYFPRWISAKSDPIANMETATKAIHRISRETQTEIVKKGINEDPTFFKEEDNNIINNRIVYAIGGLTDSMFNCSEHIDGIVSREGGMSSLEKKYNKIDKDAGLTSSIVSFIPVGEFLFTKGVFRIYASRTDPEYLSILLIKDWHEDKCKPDLFFYPDLRSL